jgi:hypothetical protein
MVRTSTCILSKSRFRESKIFEIDRDHQVVATRLQVVRAQISAPLRRKTQTVDLNKVINVPRCGVSTEARGVLL